MSANSTSARASFPANLSSRTRGIMLPWLAYIVTFIILLPPFVWDDSTAHFILYLRLLVAITVALKLLLPRKPGHLALYDSLTALFLLALPVLFTQGFMMFRWSEDVNVWLGAAYLLTTLVPCIFCVSFGALIAAVFGAKPLQWPAVFLAPTLYPRWWLRMLPDASVYNNIFLYEGSSLLVSIPAALVAWTLWTPQSASAENLASNKLTREIFRKELRLQKNNIFFTIATFILGVIGLFSINAADPTVATFNPDDIRDALTYIIILPLLTLILPLMIGSTATAAEKSLGVHAWQTALPISRWRFTLMKFLVIGGLLFIISGVLPYLFTLVAADNASVNTAFRHTWPFWLAFLFAAIGYYSGTIARDDYQGLLISILPITLLILAMTYADPLRLVFPAFIGWQEPILKQHILAARLLLIAAIFVIGALQIQRRQVRKFPVLAGQAAVLLAVTFALTLVNIVLERPAFHRPNYSQALPYGGHSHMQGHLVIAQPMLTVDDFSPGMPASVSLQLESERQFPVSVMTGHINRHYGYNYPDARTHPFIVMPGARVHEFSQAANSEISGISPGGHWILAHQKKSNDYRLLCGPAGLTIHSELVPRALFDYVQRITSIQLSNDHLNVAKTFHASFAGQSQAQGSDLLVKADTNTAVLIKDGALLIPYHRQRWYGMNLNSRGFTLRMLPQNDNTTSQVALLEPLPEHGHYKIAGVVNGEITDVTSDGKWSVITRDPAQIIVREAVPPEFLENPSAADPKTYTLPVFRPQENGTTISLRNYPEHVQVIHTGNADYLAWPYSIFGPVTIGNRLAAKDMNLGIGALVLNLNTGAETLVPFNIPWSRSTSAELLSTFRGETTATASWQHLTFRGHPQGPIAAAQANTIIIANPVLGKWSESNVAYTTAVLPAGSGVHNIGFLSKNEIIATDGKTLYKITIPDTRYPDLVGTTH